MLKMIVWSLFVFFDGIWIYFQQLITTFLWSCQGGKKIKKEVQVERNKENVRL